jgi:molybdate transport system regulatory protein
MRMSYNRAWMLVQDMNRLFRKPLVKSVRGGGKGGGAELTPTGLKVLARYKRMERTCHLANRGDWQALRRLIR